MNNGVIQFDKQKRNAEETLEAAAKFDVLEVLVVITTDSGVHILASDGMDRLHTMGALLAGAVDRWDFE